MEPMSGGWESGLLAALELSCERVCRMLAESSGLPEHKVRKLRRQKGFLVECTDSEIDWKALSDELSQADTLSSLLSATVGHLEKGSLVELMVRDPAQETRANAFWQYVVLPILKCYGMKQSDWRWDPTLARELIAEWNAEQALQTDGNYRTISPLRFFDGPDDAVPIADGLIIRPFTDREREELWQDYGGGNNSLGGLALNSWSHVIDFSWQRSPQSQLGHDVGIDAIEDVVRVLRIHHPGMVQRTIVWTRWDPPTDPSTSPYHQVFLSAPYSNFEYEAMRDINDETFHSERVSRTQIDFQDGDKIGVLLRNMRRAEEDRRFALALRRFDAAYSRYAQEDSLIDLWVAFEALLLPDGQSKLSLRAALRIAAITGSENPEQSEAFKQARLSYKCRSQVVHGEAPVEGLDSVVEATRELARRVLQVWILNPPEGGIKDLDRLL